ncbi:MAG: chorismate-binding protein, partial [Gammaproteobacteria bacterium]|nr:chorismate-binding protein [Gammaproteobacteria bacterium]
MVNKTNRSNEKRCAVEQRECSAALDLITLHQAHPERYPYLLQSVAAGPIQARFDILFAHPTETLVLQLDGSLQRGDQPLADNDFLKQLDSWWQQELGENSDAIELPFYGGWFLYLGYELAAQVEPNLKLPMQGFAKALPVAYATRVPAAIIRDHHQDKNWLIAESGYIELLDVMQQDIEALDMPERKGTDAPFVTGLREDEPLCYLNAVERVKQYIIDGDVFQANLSREWRGEMADGVSVADIYRKLCQQNPAPFAGLACYQDTAVISSSPERL